MIIICFGSLKGRELFWSRFSENKYYINLYVAVYGSLRCLALVSADLDDKMVPKLIPALFPCLYGIVSCPQVNFSSINCFSVMSFCSGKNSMEYLFIACILFFFRVTYY